MVQNPSLCAGIPDWFYLWRNRYFLLCDIDFLIGVDVQSEKIDKIRTSEIAEGNYEIENWTAYEKKGDRLFFCDGSLYEFSPKYVFFRLTNGLLFGNSFKESTLYEESEKDSQEYPYMRIGNLLWMAKNLSIQPKEKDLVFFDAVAGLKIMPRSACLYSRPLKSRPTRITIGKN